MRGKGARSQNLLGLNGLSWNLALKSLPQIQTCMQTFSPINQHSISSLAEAKFMQKQENKLSPSQNLLGLMDWPETWHYGYFVAYYLTHNFIWYLFKNISLTFSFLKEDFLRMVQKSSFEKGTALHQRSLIILKEDFQFYFSLQPIETRVSVLEIRSKSFCISWEGMAFIMTLHSVMAFRLMLCLG